MVESASWSAWASAEGSGWTWPLCPEPGYAGPRWSNQNDSPDSPLVSRFHHHFFPEWLLVYLLFLRGV